MVLLLVKNAVLCIFKILITNFIKAKQKTRISEKMVNFRVQWIMKCVFLQQFSFDSETILQIHVDKNE